MTSDPTKTPTDGKGKNYSSWSLPNVTSSVLLSSAEKEARERKDQRFKKPKKTGPVDAAAGESIEVVETLEETFKPITADQLQAITDAAEKEGYDAGYEKGSERGYEEGEKSGYSAGLEKAADKVIERCERIDRIIEALLMPLESERKQLEILMIDMICQLTEAVVMREIDSDSSQVIKLVDDALNAIPAGSDKFSLYLNEQDIALVESHLNDQQMDKKFNYYTDENLLPGGCRLETKNSTVSNTVEQRLKKVIDDFMHKRIAASDEQIEEVKKALDESSPTNDSKRAVDGAAENTSSNSETNIESDSEHNSEHSSEHNSEHNSEHSSEHNSEHKSEPSSQRSPESTLENKPLSDPSQNHAGELAESTLTNSSTKIDEEATIKKADSSQGEEHQQEPKKTTESMSPLESAQQKRDEQIPQANNNDSNNESHKDSDQQGKNDAPI
jgi:flagellar assembly protein FliH